jgi:hypothetical protein
MKKINSPVLALIAGWFLMAGGDALIVVGQTAGQGRELHQTYDLAVNGTVSVSNVSGYIRVTTWNENKVKVDAVKHGRRDEDVNLVEIQVTATPDRVEIRTIYPRGRSNSVSVDYDLKVPRTAGLSSLNSTSGDITVIGPVARVIARSTSGNVGARDVAETASLASTSGNVNAEKINGELRASSTSGNVNINEVASRLYAQSTSGSVTAVQIRDDATVSVTSGTVRLDRVGGRAVARSMTGWVVVNEVGGDVQAESTSDNVTVTNVRGRVTASAISGNIIIRNVNEGVRAGAVSGKIEITDTKGRIEANTTSDAIILNNIDSQDILAKSTSGSVRFVGKLHENGHYEFESFSSDVVLILPPDSNFTLTTKSHSGSVNTEFPLQLGQIRAVTSRGNLIGTVGKGGAAVRAATFSGNVFIKKSM